MNKKAFITGITGQDGFFITELLLEKGYEVHGLIRRNALNTFGHLKNLRGFDKIHFHKGDLTDANSINSIFQSTQFDEVYHLGAQSFVKESFDNPAYTMNVNSGGTLNVLEAVRMFNPTARMYNASTSEMFGNAPKHGGKEYYDELSMFDPQSPYGVAKVAAYELCNIYKESYDLFISNGILFNHESQYRGDEFVTQKIVKGLVAIQNDKSKAPLVLGNLSAVRDWGFAGDYVRAMWLMLQHHRPDNFVIATGECHSVRDFCEKVLDKLNTDFNFYNTLVFEDVIKTSEDHERPCEVNKLVGSSAKAKRLLGWEPKYDLDGLINIMVNNLI